MQKISKLLEFNSMKGDDYKELSIDKSDSYKIIRKIYK